MRTALAHHDAEGVRGLLQLADEVRRFYPFAPSSAASRRRT
ncbi:hypothetical protein [Streptomyces katrae]|nr:hypothetical protein [Streptomyces katrae]